VLLYLSYADEDIEIAHEVAKTFTSDGVSVYPQQTDAGRPDMTAETEQVIRQANAFIALLSPNSLTSAACRRERELAMYWEQRCWDAGAPVEFVRVLEVRDTPYHEAGALHLRPWFDLTDRNARARVLRALANNLDRPSGQPPAGNQPPSGADNSRRWSEDFRNRTTELEDIRVGITDPDGHHFWLVTAPPQLGKSWLLGKLAYELRWDHRWQTELVDIKELSPEYVGDADNILRLMFGLDLSTEAETDVNIAASIAESMVDNDEFRLCLLDSAELLDNATVSRLREQLNIIWRQTVGISSRLALVVASRRIGGWTGVEPAPPLAVRELTEFSVDVVKESLEKLAVKTRPPRAVDLELLAERVHRLSEGLPAVLAACLGWIQGCGWQNLERLEDPATFQEVAGRYIERDLLSATSLRGFGATRSDEEQAAIRYVLELLAPYRLLTTSHLSLHAKESQLAGMLVSLNWSVEQLWDAVTQVDLRQRPQSELWHAVHPPIRRLLYRHWYPGYDDRIETHQRAAEFLGTLVTGLHGSDRCKFFVECLWHRAQVLVLERAADLAHALLGFAGDLAAAHLGPDPLLGQTSLRKTAAQSMSTDQELADTLRHVPGLFDRLIDIVRGTGTPS
jgi:hypothetical protein